ncbi:MAG: ATP-binding cassette domain-containing protein [Balneolaceae bacterium]
MLKTENITVSYETSIVLKNLYLSFYPGEVHGILGVNGSGKTTLFRTICGLLKVDQGIIAYDNHSDLSKKIAYLETEPFFYPYMRGTEYLKLLSYDSKTSDIRLWRDLFKIPLDNFIETYSTGMKKKLALIGVLLLDRPVILLDEPHNGLDLEGVSYLDRILSELKKKGKIVIVSSHIVEVLRKNCDKISLLHNRNVKTTLENSDFSMLETEISSFFSNSSDAIIKQLFG